MWGYRSSRTLAVGAAVAAFGLLCVLPFGYMLAQLITSGASVAPLILEARQRVLLSNTAVLGVGTAVLATLIGAPLGLVLARVLCWRRGLGRIRGLPAKSSVQRQSTESGISSRLCGGSCATSADAS